MKIYLITDKPYPNGMAATNRVKCYAKTIIHGGNDCEVIIFTRTERYGVTPWNTEGSGTAEGIPFQYIGGTPLRHANPFVRKFHDWHDIYLLKKHLKSHLHAGDIILTYCDKRVGLVNQLADFAHQQGAKIVRDLCELPFGTSDETPKNISGREDTFHTQFPRLDGVICISDSLMKLASQFTCPSCKLIKIPILVDFPKYELPDLSDEAEVPYIFHAGTLTDQKDGILGLLEGFAIARQRYGQPFRFLSTGYLEKSSQCKAIKALISQYGIENDVSFLGYLSEKELRDRLSHATMVVINKAPTQQNRYCFATKTAEYLAASKPLITTRVGEAMNWLVHGQSAVMVDHSSPGQIADAIITLLTDPLFRKKIGAGGKKLCKEAFDYTNYGETLSSFFHSLYDEEQRS